MRQKNFKATAFTPHAGAQAVENLLIYHLFRFTSRAGFAYDVKMNQSSPSPYEAFAALTPGRFVDFQPSFFPLSVRDTFDSKPSEKKQEVEKILWRGANKKEGIISFASAGTVRLIFTENLGVAMT